MELAKKSVRSGKKWSHHRERDLIWLCSCPPASPISLRDHVEDTLSTTIHLSSAYDSRTLPKSITDWASDQASPSALRENSNGVHARWNLSRKSRQLYVGLVAVESYFVCQWLIIRQLVSTMTKRATSGRLFLNLGSTFCGATGAEIEMTPVASSGEEQCN